jgi:hypothetical protein
MTSGSDAGGAGGEGADPERNKGEEIPSPRVRILAVGASGAHNAEWFYIRALRSIGAEVVFLDQYEGVGHRMLTRLALTRLPRIDGLVDRLPVNRGLPEAARRADPDLVLVFKGEMLSDRAIRELSGSHRLALLYPDAYRFPRLLSRLPHFCCVLSPASRLDFYYGMGARRAATLPWACDPEVHRRLPVKRERKVALLGTFYPNRLRAALALRGLPLEVRGPLWPPPIRSGPPLRGEDYVRAMNEAAVNLDVHHPSDVEADAPNMRVFEVAGSGGLLLSDDLPSIHRYFGPREVDTFRNLGEMREKAIQYLDDPELADEMGSRAAARCRSEHTYVHRARALLGMAMGAKYRATGARNDKWSVHPLGARCPRPAPT